MMKKQKRTAERTIRVRENKPRHDKEQNDEILGADAERRVLYEHPLAKENMPCL